MRTTETDIAFDCRHCNHPLEAPREMEDELIRCPACDMPIRVPGVRRAMRVVPSQKTERATGPVGVKGWLLFFCIGVLVWGPLYRVALAAIAIDVLSIDRASHPKVWTAVVVESVWEGIVLLFSFVVAVQLFRKEPFTLMLVKCYLLALIVGTSIVYVAVYIYVRESLTFTESVVVPLLAHGLWFAIWWAYFTHSRRVRNTYTPSALTDDAVGLTSGKSSPLFEFMARQNDERRYR